MEELIHSSDSRIIRYLINSFFQITANEKNKHTFPF